ncbi:uncharacterized protein J4E88_003781 [Alternaria novae-zelandiae]|uniref:uncharacterized protein n=1 Tax=Alternaria novae-zelandiae TaxID=430562 RepID=UPI0020C513F8|nr:uncharacterized protein J4E88_003781 [Alternaria novae-zelandiae]KAI4685944.1 hypothetical protein J4E88_003781 [Alternaria novae-zelandiae]
MAELPRQGKQVPKRQKPSRLRHEVRPESTDDERDRKKPVPQEPDSDAIVPETQPNQDGYYVRNDFTPEREPDLSDLPTSPGTAELLQRTAVTKKADIHTSTWVPFALSTRTKETPGLNNNSGPADVPTFAFTRSQPSQVPKKASPKDKAFTTRSVPNTESTISGVHKQVVHASQDASVATEPAYVSPPIFLGNDDRHKTNPATEQEVPLFQQPATKESQNESAYPLPTQPDTPSKMPPSAQPDARPAPGASKARVVKKSKKGRKGQLSQQREGQRPPRSNVLARHAQQAMTTGKPVAETSNNPLATDDATVHTSQSHAVQAPAPINDLNGHAYVEDSPLVKEHECVAHVEESCNTTQTIPDTTFQEFPESSAQREFPTSSMFVTSTLPPKVDDTEREQQPLADVHYQDHGLVSAEERTPLPAQDSGRHIPENHESVAIATQSNQPQLPEVSASSQQSAPLPKDSEAILHRISHQDASHRVAKPRRKLRASGPVSNNPQEQAISSSLDQAIESVRVAMLADKFRAKHESMIIAKQREVEIAGLQDTINDHVQTIAERDESIRSLKEAFSQLTDKAKTNQKFVHGLQQDYEKLQKSATSFQKQSQMTLTEKITELEDEKKTLYHECETAVDKLAATQQKMKSALDDVYGRFIISESKRIDLIENLGKRDAEIGDERRKRDDMEKQLLSIVQSIPGQIVDASDTLAKKLESLQTSIEQAPAHDDRDNPIEECLDALRTLQMSPALTAKDIEKMESTLDSGLDTLSETIRSEPTPDTELRTFIGERLNSLQEAMLRYDKATTENRKTQELNVSLKVKLEEQQQHSRQLNEQIKELQQSEANLRAQSDQLERDLNELRVSPPVPHVDTEKLEREAVDLRQQLKKIEGDLKAANNKVETIEQERDTYKSNSEDVKTQLLELQQEHRDEDKVAMREEIVKDCESRFIEKERSLKSEIDRLMTERDEKENAHQEVSTNLDAAYTQIDELEDKIRTLESKALETTNIQEQLRQTTEELHTKSRGHTELSRRCEENVEKISELQGLLDKSQAQAVEQRTTMQTMREEADTTLGKAQQDASNTLQLLHNQISKLQEEKKDVSSKVQQARTNEGKLRQDIAELRAEKEADESRCQKDADQEREKLNEEHRTVIDDWNRRLTEKDAALEKAEADLRLAADQFKAKLAADREKAESNMQKLERQYQDVIKAEREKVRRNQQDGSQVQGGKSVLQDPRDAVQAAKSRKKVQRQNHSVLHGLHGQSPHFEKPSWALDAEFSQTQLDDDDLFATQHHTHEAPNNADSIDHEPGTATETQDLGSASISQDIFNMFRPSQQDTNRQVSSSLNLSSISLDDLAALDETQPASGAMLRGYVRDSSNHASAQANAKATPAVDNISVAGSHSSRSSGRPRSQANTASRMMPPPGNGFRYSQSGTGIHTEERGGSNRHTTYGKPLEMLGGSSTHASDPRDQTRPSSQQTNNQYDPRRSAQPGSQHGVTHPTKQGYTEKRKSSSDLAEKESASKKQRTRSQSRPLNSSADLPGKSPYASGKSASTSRPKAQKTLLYGQASASTPSRSKTPVASSRVRGRVTRQAPSSSGAYSPRGQPSSQISIGGPTRRSSTRLTRSQSKDARYELVSN